MPSPVADFGNSEQRAHEAVRVRAAELEEVNARLQTEIAGRKRIEEALRLSEEKFSSAFANNPAAILITRLDDGTFLEVNDTFVSLIGYGRDELIGHSARTLPIWPSVEAADRFVGELRARGALHGWEQEYRKKSGELFVAQLAAQILTERGDKIILTTMVDVTERKKAERALRESEALLRAVADNSPDAIYVKDAEGRWLMGNPAALRAVGKSVEEVMGKTDAEVHLNPEIGRIVRQNDLRVLEHGKPEAVEEVVDTPEGRRIFLSTKAPRRDTDGRVIGLIGISRDVTESKRAQEALRQSEEEHRHIVEHAPTGIYELDYAAPRFKRVNDAICHMLGYDRDELLSLNPFDLLDDEGKSRFQERIRKLSAGEPVDDSVTFRVFRKDGQVIWALLNVKVTYKDEKPSGAFVVAHDITRLKEMELSLQQAKEFAVAATEAKSRFLANMSHELRTPMNAILGMIDLALPKATNPTVVDCLQTAKGSAGLLLTLLDDLLDSAKIESGKLDLEATPFSLRRVLEHVTRVLSIRASEKSLAFSCNVSSETPDGLVGDRMRLQQVLLNLAGNAIKFTDRGRVEIRVRALSRAEGSVKFWIHDTGIGIPPDALRRLFQPFAQADASMTRRFGGTGLGLSIAKGLIEMMGGALRVRSKAGRGSTFFFTIRLPLAKELPAEVEPPAAFPTAAPAPLRVLLVEDNAANQKLAAYVLQDRGHIVEIAGDGQEAVMLTERNSYDAILMDVQMPGMDGFEATAAIRDREGDGRHAPIIAMTAYAMTGDRERCLAAGMDGYLAKPIEGHEMIALVESLASASRPAASVGTTVRRQDRTSAEHAAVFDAQGALRLNYGKPDLLDQMIQFFRDDAEKVLPQIRWAFERSDATEVSRLAHRLKGTLAHLAAEPAVEAARRVEHLDISGANRVAAEEAIAALERECESLKAAVAEYNVSAASSQRWGVATPTPS
ncbi:MAG: PAS domain S-box protein [Planctomycetaceae bacterium]|nr:PAS domain S-box protein [Planctomycetaceae bacterium]